MRRLGFAVLFLLLAMDTAAAQYYWGPPNGRGYNYYRPPPSFFDWGWNDYAYRRRFEPPAAPGIRPGGERPTIAPLGPRKIAFPSDFPANSIVIDSRGRQLFFVISPKVALVYPISVGREGFSWSGTETISRIAAWPDWYPPVEMRARDPRLPEKMTGGLRNPLGAMAIYLGNSLYRIHGTNDASSIGRAASSGCFRMLNGHVVDLASRVEVGTTVTVVSRLPPELERIVAQQAPPPSQPQVRARMF